jgi:hypothetical protein
MPDEQPHQRRWESATKIVRQIFLHDHWCESTDRPLVPRDQPADHRTMSTIGPRHPTNRELADRLAELRHAAGLDLEAFAARAEIDPSVVLELESGTRSWMLADIVAYAEALAVSLPTIFASWDEANRS